MFYRETALEYDRRVESFRPLHTADFDNVPGGLCPTRLPGDGPPATRRTMADLCRREPNLDYLVLASAIDRAWFAEWRPPGNLYVPKISVDASGHLSHIAPRLLDNFYVYRCADLRK